MTEWVRMFRKGLHKIKHIPLQGQAPAAASVLARVSPVAATCIWLGTERLLLPHVLPETSEFAVTLKR